MTDLFGLDKREIKQKLRPQAKQLRELDREMGHSNLPVRKASIYSDNYLKDQDVQKFQLITQVERNAELLKLHNKGE